MKKFKKFFLLNLKIIWVLWKEIGGVKLSDIRLSDIQNFMLILLVLRFSERLVTWAISSRGVKLLLIINYYSHIIINSIKLKNLIPFPIIIFRKQLSVASRTPASSETCCSTRVALCTMILLILSVVVAGLAVFTYGLSKDVQDLKNRLGPGMWTFLLEILLCQWWFINYRRGY